MGSSASGDGGEEPAVTGAHMIVLPGGGYAAHAAHEAEPVAGWLRGLGITASVFRYRSTSAPGAPRRAAARDPGPSRRRADRVGLTGFSAGGHLASLAALAPGAGSASRRSGSRCSAIAITSMETET